MIFRQPVESSFILRSIVSLHICRSVVVRQAVVIVERVVCQQCEPRIGRSDRGWPARILLESVTYRLFGGPTDNGELWSCSDSRGEPCLRVTCYSRRALNRFHDDLLVLCRVELSHHFSLTEVGHRSFEACTFPHGSSAAILVFWKIPNQLTFAVLAAVEYSWILSVHKIGWWVLIPVTILFRTIGYISPPSASMLCLPGSGCRAIVSMFGGSGFGRTSECGPLGVLSDC